MKKIVVVFTLCFFIVAGSCAQAPLPAPDRSPMDESYCPANYPLLKIQDKPSDPLLARVIYSRPQVNGRVIFGDVIEYGKVWRLGANEATEIEFYQNVKMGETRIKKGRYTLYAIPNDDKWTLILNKETDTWGAFKYDSTKDVARMNAVIQKQAIISESFTIIFDKAGNGYELQFYWDNIKVVVPITL